MAERIISSKVRLLPNLGGDQNASDPVSLEEEESLASLAYLSGLPLTNRPVTLFVQSFSDASAGRLLRQGLA